MSNTTLINLYIKMMYIYTIIEKEFIWIPIHKFNYLLLPLKSILQSIYILYPYYNTHAHTLAITLLKKKNKWVQTYLYMYV